MRKLAHVPSPEEIQRVLRARERGKDVNIAPISTVLQTQTASKVDKLAAKVDELMGKSTKHKSPAEIRMGLDAVLAYYKMEPAEELVRMVMEKDTTGEFMLDPDTRIRILMELNNYRLPKLKSVEMTGNVDMRHEIIIVRYGEDGIAKRDEAKPIDVKTLVQLEAPRVTVAADGGGGGTDG